LEPEYASYNKRYTSVAALANFIVLDRYLAGFMDADVLLQPSLNPTI
jgi:hypothetical protein